MAKPNILREIERERGQPLEKIILPLVNKGGQKLAALRLGVTPATISGWLKANDYRKVERWIKERRA